MSVLWTYHLAFLGKMALAAGLALTFVGTLWGAMGFQSLDDACPAGGSSSPLNLCGLSCQSGEMEELTLCDPYVLGGGMKWLIGANVALLVSHLLSLGVRSWPRPILPAKPRRPGRPRPQIRHVPRSRRKRKRRETERSSPWLSTIVHSA